MEGTLDEIAGGDAAWQPFLAGFFLGDDGLRPRIKAKMDEVDALTAKDIDLGTPSRFAVRIGRYGAYVQGTVGGEDVRATIPQTLTLEELHDDVLERLLTQRQQGPDALGNDPVSGTPITVREGRYGPYYQLGDGQDVKRASLPKGKTPADADLDEALFLLSLPRGLGDHPDGGAVEANVGRYGPYVVWNKPDQTRDYRNLSNDDALRTVDLAQALALLAEAKRGRTRAGGVLRELGAHPDDGKPVQLLSGRYGPYVKHGKTNASIPRDRDAAAVTLEEAVALLAERRARS
jgi:DNA topoisomerase-1